MSKSFIIIFMRGVSLRLTLKKKSLIIVRVFNSKTRLPSTILCCRSRVLGFSDIVFV